MVRHCIVCGSGRIVSIGAGGAHRFRGQHVVAGSYRRGCVCPACHEKKKIIFVWVKPSNPL